MLPLISFLKLSNCIREILNLSWVSRAVPTPRIGRTRNPHVYYTYSWNILQLLATSNSEGLFIMLNWKVRTSLLFLVCFASGLARVAKSASDTPTIPSIPRALPDAPNGYTPASVQCPFSNPSARNAANISQHEKDWLQKRQGKRLKAMQSFFTRLNIPDFNVTRYFAESQATSLPNIGIAFSGGGYRALLNGAGAFAAFDERTRNATAPGHLGGLVQSATYISGLSGGSWLVGSIYMNNFTTVTALLNAHTSGVWEFDQSVLSGPTGDTGYFRQLRYTVDGKEDAGFPVSITDYW